MRSGPHGHQPTGNVLMDAQQLHEILERRKIVSGYIAGANPGTAVYVESLHADVGALLQHIHETINALPPLAAA